MCMATRSWVVLAMSTLLVAGCAGGDGAAPALDGGPVDYLALGDSFSSGEGTADIEPACGRGPAAYPHLVADHLETLEGLGRLEIHACTGARVADVDGQLEAVAGERFGLITLTVGGNDVGFSEVLLDCAGLDDLVGLFGPSDENAPSETEERAGRCDVQPDELEERLAAVVPALTSLYRRIVDDHLTDDGLLVVLGYPDLFGAPPGGRRTCDGFSVADIDQLRGTTEHLDDTLARVVADVDRASYMSALEAFEGHGRCGDDPWIRGHALRPRVKSSFHPDETGHEAMAGLVQDALR